ncbi:OmpA family protein [Citrobacter arsenatis]|uniref:OmpA family protein n=1 Tax=Citrobacter arsenatis TaxID=2546350 RepID=A0A4P6WM49_9ENTR|nr:OmpA family protein [Citrobacter arsenatis]QBM22762.1 OmpA family protein [Citrobacter arsenatis]
MSPAQLRGLALGAALLSGVVCLGFLPVARLAAVVFWLATLGLIAAVWIASSRSVEPKKTLQLDNLPESTYRQPVVLVCGDLPQPWPQTSLVLTVTQGCWIRVEDHQDLGQVARQVLWLRPNWGRQLSVMVTVCPQKHADAEALTSHLLSLRWQISQLRKKTGHSVPLVLNGQTGSMMMNDMLWQTAFPGDGISVWRESSAPSSITAWITTGGAMAMHQQVLMNSLMTWFHMHVNAVFMDENPDVPVIAPAAVLWGMGPVQAGSLPSSVWTVWLSRCTSLQQVAGWQPHETDSTVISLFPDFVLPLLPEAEGLTPRGRTWRCALGIFTFAAAVALLSSGWNNRQLLYRVSFDITRYDRISMDDYGPKADAFAVLRGDAAQLDDWARNGVPTRMGLGLYQGERLRIPVLDAIRSYVPPSPPPKSQPKPKPVPKIVRLDSMSLFDSGKSVLKTGSTKMLVNSLVGIKAKPGWLIVVAGHTDNTGNPQLNQTLSLKRAESVRNWMRDTGDVPESCFAVQGYGAGRPIATNDTTEGRALNRRVEISLVPQANACLIPGKPSASSQDDGASQHNGE